jgi:hypothetical protein
MPRSGESQHVPSSLKAPIPHIDCGEPTAALQSLRHTHVGVDHFSRNVLRIR